MRGWATYGYCCRARLDPDTPDLSRSGGFAGSHRGSFLDRNYAVERESKVPSDAKPLSIEYFRVDPPLQHEIYFNKAWQVA
jgi:hypothetical protein